MTCAPTDRLLQTLRVQVPGVTDDMLDLQIFNVIDEFCRRTSAWRHRDEVKIDEGMTEYSYGLPSGGTLVRMIGVSHNNVPVPYAGQGGSFQTGTGILDPALHFSDGDTSYFPEASDLSDTNIFSWAVYRPDVITINVPAGTDVQYPAVMEMALSISKDCLECASCGDWAIPEWMWDMYFTDWLDGTLGRLYGMPAKPWASVTHAQYHGRRFRTAMGYRKQETPRGFVMGAPGPWRFPGGWTR